MICRDGGTGKLHDPLLVGMHAYSPVASPVTPKLRLMNARERRRRKSYGATNPTSYDRDISSPNISWGLFFRYALLGLISFFLVREIWFGFLSSYQTITLHLRSDDTYFLDPASLFSSIMVSGFSIIDTKQVIKVYHSMDEPVTNPDKDVKVKYAFSEYVMMTNEYKYQGKKKAEEIILTILISITIIVITIVCDDNYTNNTVFFKCYPML